MPRPSPPSSPAAPLPLFAALLASSASPERLTTTGTVAGSSGQLSKGVWSEEEHARFLDALKRFPQGPWKAITAHVGTRSIRQVQTHAQKYMEKVERRARGLKTAQPRLVRRDHKIDDEVEAWWKRENGMLAGSPSRPKATPRRRRRDHSTGGSDAAASATRDAEVVDDEEDEDEDLEDDDYGLDFEPLPLAEALAPASPLPTLEECLAVVSECLVDPMSALHLEQSTDAIYFSGHKFIGGPGSPGVLVAKTRVLPNAVPTIPGGGTVFFVSERGHRYLPRREEREEGGTPDIIGSVRLGVQGGQGLDSRFNSSNVLVRSVSWHWSAFASHDKLVLLGHDGVDQLPIFSFLALRTRGGCHCAGPYAARLLGIAKKDLVALERQLVHGNEVVRIGSSRLSIPYFMDDDEIAFILEAIHFVGHHGYKFLPLYSFIVSTGQWVYSAPQVHQERPVDCSLGDFSIEAEPATVGSRSATDASQGRVRFGTMVRLRARGRDANRADRPVSPSGTSRAISFGSGSSPTRSTESPATCSHCGFVVPYQ